eukprot:3459881-Karenia_brevis.AAC.1
MCIRDSLKGFLHLSARLPQPSRVLTKCLQIICPGRTEKSSNCGIAVTQLESQVLADLIVQTGTFNFITGAM